MFFWRKWCWHWGTTQVHCLSGFEAKGEGQLLISVVWQLQILYEWLSSDSMSDDAQIFHARLGQSQRVKHSQSQTRSSRGLTDWYCGPTSAVVTMVMFFGPGKRSWKMRRSHRVLAVPWAQCIQLTRPAFCPLAARCCFKNPVKYKCGITWCGWSVCFCASQGQHADEARCCIGWLVAEMHQPLDCIEGDQNSMLQYVWVHGMMHTRESLPHE